MENIVFIILLLITIGLFKIIFKISLKETKGLQENKELEKITDKFPDNVEVAREMLKMLNNETVVYPLLLQ